MTRPPSIPSRPGTPFAVTGTAPAPTTPSPSPAPSAAATLGAGPTPPSRVSIAQRPDWAEAAASASHPPGSVHADTPLHELTSDPVVREQVKTLDDLKSTLLKAQAMMRDLSKTKSAAAGNLAQEMLVLEGQLFERDVPIPKEVDAQFRQAFLTLQDHAIRENFKQGSHDLLQAWPQDHPKDSEAPPRFTALAAKLEGDIKALFTAAANDDSSCYGPGLRETALECAHILQGKARQSRNVVAATMGFLSDNSRVVATFGDSGLDAELEHMLEAAKWDGLAYRDFPAGMLAIERERSPAEQTLVAGGAKACAEIYRDMISEDPQAYKLIADMHAIGAAQGSRSKAAQLLDMLVRVIDIMARPSFQTTVTSGAARPARKLPDARKICDQINKDLAAEGTHIDDSIKTAVRRYVESPSFNKDLETKRA
jgi:hypothetical protein